MRKLLLLLSFTLLSACGGGGGAGGGLVSSDSLGQQASISFEGVASRGLLINAPFRVFAAKAAATAAPLATGVTGPDGSFSFRLNALPTGSSPIVIEVSINTKTVMLDESGVLLPDGSFPLFPQTLPSSLKMRVMIPFSSLNTTETQVFNVTPFSEFATRMALSAAGNIMANVTEQHIQLSRLFLVNTLGGLDPITTKAVNANSNLITSDQERLMLLLTGMQIAANNTPSCSGDPTKITCALSSFWSMAQMNISNGVANFPSASNLRLALANFVTDARNNMASRTTQYHRNVRSQSIALDTISSLNVQAAQTAYGLQSFLTDLRTGIVRGTENLANGLKILTNNFDALVPDENYEASVLASALRNSCNWLQTPNAASGFGLSCVTNNSLNLVVTPVAGYANSNYDIRHWMSVGNQTYVAAGRINVGRFLGEGVANLQGNLNIVNCPLNQTNIDSKCKSVTDVQINATVTSDTDIRLNQFNSMNLDRLVIKVYDKTTQTRTNTLEITGLTLSKTSDMNYISGMGNLTLTNSAGNRFSGRISNLMIRDFLAGTPIAESKLLSVWLDVNAETATNAPFLNFSFRYSGLPSLPYSPNLATSETNYLRENFNVSIAYPGIGTNLISLTQNSYNTADFELRLSSPSGRFLLAKGPLLFSTTKDSWVIPSAGLAITSSSTYSARLYSDWMSGEFVGNIFNNGEQIGAVLPNGLITANGIEMSLR